MKKLFPLALLLCLSVSMSSFAPAGVAKAKQGSVAFFYPTSGTITGHIAGPVDYHIDLAAFHITYTRGTSTWGPFYFGGTDRNNAQANSDYTAQLGTGITAAKIVNGNLSFDTLY